MTTAHLLPASTCESSPLAVQNCFPLSATETSEDQDLQPETGPPIPVAVVLDSGQPPPDSGTLSVRRLVLRRGLVLLLMLVVLAAGVLTAKLLTKLLELDEWPLNPMAEETDVPPPHLPTFPAPPPLPKAKSECEVANRRPNVLVWFIWSALG